MILGNLRRCKFFHAFVSFIYNLVLEYGNLVKAVILFFFFLSFLYPHISSRLLFDFFYCERNGSSFVFSTRHRCSSLDNNPHPTVADIKSRYPTASHYRRLVQTNLLSSQPSASFMKSTLHNVYLYTSVQNNLFHTGRRHV